MGSSRESHANLYRNACIRTRQVGNRLGPASGVSGLLGVVCVAARLGRLASLAPWPAARDQGGVRLELSQHGGLCCGSRNGCGMMDPELGEGLVCRTERLARCYAMCPGYAAGTLLVRLRLRISAST